MRVDRKRRAKKRGLRRMGFKGIDIDLGLSYDEVVADLRWHRWADADDGALEYSLDG